MRSREDIENHSEERGTGPPARDLWMSLLSRSLTTAEQLAAALPVDKHASAAVIERYPVRINPYYLSLIADEGDPCWRQAVPDARELVSTTDAADPLSEKQQSPVPGIIHRYPDRVVFLVSNQCALYCRHCMRKRSVGIEPQPDVDRIQHGIDYIRTSSSVQDVILSGGDPLMLMDHELQAILHQLRAIPHVSLLRIHTRMPCTLPQRITDPLVHLLREFHPIYVNTQFNHPLEITPEAAEACARLADAGIPLGCQTVLLKGVNDTSAVMATLLRKLAAIRVKPYYLHHPDPVAGVGHFRPPVKTGLHIMAALRGHTSGLCVPHYMIDLPGGGGKIPVLPEYVQKQKNGVLVVKTFDGKTVTYPA